MKRWIPVLIGTSLVFATIATTSLSCPQPVAAQEKPAVQLGWQLETGALRNTQPHVGTDGTIYVGAIKTASRDQSDPITLSAYSKEGKLKWEFPTQETTTNILPGIAGSSDVYFSYGKHLTAFDANGKQKWSDLFGESITQLAQGADGTLFVGTSHTLTALNTSGATLWSTPLQTEPQRLFALTDGSVVVQMNLLNMGALNGSDKLHLLTFGKDGKLAREINLPVDAQANTSYTLDGSGHIYLISGLADSAQVNEYQPDGTSLWSTKVDAMATTVTKPLLDKSGNLYFGTHDFHQYHARLFSLDATGKTRWHVDSDKDWVLDQLGVGADGTLYATLETPSLDANGIPHFADTVTAISPTGSQKWTYPLPSSPSGLAVGAKGAVDISSYSKLYSLTDTALAPKPLTVSLNGKQVDFPDAQPFVNNDQRTMVPVRFIAEQLGAQLDWNGSTQTITMHLNGKEIVLQVGHQQATVDGNTVTFDTEAVIQNERTFVPLRFITESFGATVNWNADENRVEITKSI